MTKHLISVLLLVSALAGCGNSISNAQKYSRNKAPALSITSVTNPDGTPMDLTRIVSYSSYSVTVAASDPDGDSVRYSFSSSSGSFSSPAETSSGCTVIFKTGFITGGQTVSLNISVTDSRGGAAAASCDLGKGKLGPVISLETDKSQIQSSAVVTLSVTANCRGTFIIDTNRDGSISTAAQAISSMKANSSAARLSYSSAGSESKIVISGPKSATAAKVSLTAEATPPSAYDKTYQIWVAFEDALGQADAVSVPVYVDDVKPSIAKSDPAADSLNIATTRNFYITFSEKMNPASFSDGSLSVAPALIGNTGTVKFISYNAQTKIASFSISGLSRYVSYTASLAAVEDPAGNDISASGNPFTFTTTTTYALTYDSNGTGPDISGVVPVDGNAYAEGEAAVVCGNTGTLAKTSHQFEGWNTEADGTGITYAPGSRLSFDAENVTLYAKWNRNPYQVTYDVNEGLESYSDPFFYKAGDTVTVIDDMLERSGFTFMGWSTVRNGTVVYAASDQFIINANITLYAVWGKIPVSSIVLSQTLIETYVGFNSVPLTATVYPEDASDKSVTWSSSGIATVTNGVVTFPAAGTAIIITATAHDGSGISAACTVTVKDSYLITTLDDLAILRANLGGHFTMGNDISLSSYTSWDPIGTFDTLFTGQLDGNGKTISNLKITNGMYIGFFKVIAPSGSVKNLKIIAALDTTSGYPYAGALAGMNSGNITKCYTSGSVNGSGYIGGLVGDNQSTGVITLCSSSCSVVTDSCPIGGGLVGNNKGTISESYATGAVEGSTCCGGLVGQNDGLISNCYATGTITGGTNVGGLVGYLSSAGTISKCYSISTVTGTGSYGGLVGERDGTYSTIEISYFTGTNNNIGTYCTTLQGFSTSAWDFTLIWFVNSTMYPYLRNNP